MGSDNRCRIYTEYKEKLSIIKDLDKRILIAQKAGDEAFSNNKNTDTEKAYRLADEAGWILVDELTDLKLKTTADASALFKYLIDNAYDLSNYYSCHAYDIVDIKRVNVVLLDGTVISGIIYPYVYDNPQDMYLLQDDNSIIDLDKGWEVKQVDFC